MPEPTWRQIAEAAFTGFIGYYAASEFDFAGLQYISAQLERLVLFTYPIFVMIIGAVFYRQPLTLPGVLAAVVTYLGLAIVFAADLPEGGRATIIGTLLVLGAAISFAWHQILAKRFMGALGSALFTSIALASAGVFASLIKLYSAGPSLRPRPRSYGSRSGVRSWRPCSRPS